ncbi:MAG: GNAT family N-acetyltransferase [Ilumatobacter sp.]
MQVRRAEQNDIGQLCVTAMRAFAEDPVMRWLYPDDEVYFAPGGAVLRRAMTGWVTRNEVWCTDDGAALAVWIQPGAPADPSDEPASPPPEDLAERFSIIGPLLAAHTPVEEHWYLQLLATHPDWQRNGIASLLMRPMLERADADGIACHLETETFVNLAFYRRHGFEVESEFDIPTGRHLHRFSSFGADPDAEVGPHMWAMHRRPG